MWGGKAYQKISSVSQIPVPPYFFEGEKVFGPTVGFKLPQNAVSFLIVIQGREKKNQYAVGRLVDPNGVELVRYKKYNFNDKSLNKQKYGTSKIRSLLVPNTPRVKTVPGLYTLSIARQKTDERSDEEVDIHIIVKSLQGTHTFKNSNPNELIGTLDIHLNLPRGSKLERMPNPRGHIANILKDFRYILKKVGLHPKIKFHRVSREMYSVESHYFTDKAFEKVFSLPQQDHRINFVFLNGKNWRERNAYSYHIGGPAFLRKQHLNGIILKDLSTTGKTLAHETGHYLGLMHNWEDHLRDTKFENIMSYNKRDLLYFSEEQRQVILGHPSVINYKRTPLYNKIQDDSEEI